MVSLLVAVIITAIIFDYINGFHDAANAIATVVSTGVLHVRTAVILAGILNFVGAVTGTAVAKTIASGFADPAIVTQTVVLAALLGACAWNLITWWYGIPSSSSHALIGGLAGAVVAKAGLAAFKWAALYSKVLVPLVVSPTLGFIAAFILMMGLVWAVRKMRPATVHKSSRTMTLVSACALAFAHGSNDAQKSMGIITLALLAFVHQGHGGVPAWALPKGDGVPMWVILACAAAIGLGTMAGGQKIIKTMGTKIIRLNTLQGFAAQTAGALTILGASHLGVPVSTTHCINACIMGVGASKRVSAVRWGVAGNILTAWVLTIPLSALMAFITMLAIDKLF
ncbi:putative low-affinity inorganic phosphate transporter [Labilithrix luteola]|uniref:Putative low-affinity inorganic phosphate transporter n=1 Tax=Labilithrix luteola TaxID=1391654 RepID=A0A0K1PYX5_9BACT|nr:inorganic phosphate transporter [Labilithrix luteola]AKU98606.1 putative low-affinity inorganic phosphate transporter [Labilithrix luteola]